MQNANVNGPTKPVGMRKRKLYESHKYSNQFFWEVMPNGAWEGHPAVIVGGGPNIPPDFNWKSLHRFRTISTNRAFEKFDPTITFSMDPRFLMWVKSNRYGEAVHERFARLSTYRVWLVTYVAHLPPECYVIPVFQSYDAGLRTFSDDMTKGLGHGNNSGYAALNLAFVLGADPIYLLGFAMNHKPNRVSHWHSGHPIPQEEHTVKSFIPAFNMAAEKIKEKGRRVINLSAEEETDLRCFPIQPIKEVLK